MNDSEPSKRDRPNLANWSARVFHKLRLYVARRRKHSYTELWEMLYGSDQGNKGYIREANFAMEVAAIWRRSFDECQERTKTGT